MRNSRIALLLVASLTVGLAGCSSLSKRSSSKATTTASTSSPLVSSSRKVQADLHQTETDLGELESQVRAYK